MKEGKHTHISELCLFHPHHSNLVSRGALCCIKTQTFELFLCALLRNKYRNQANVTVAELGFGSDSRNEHGVKMKQVTFKRLFRGGRVLMWYSWSFREAILHKKLMMVPFFPTW